MSMRRRDLLRVVGSSVAGAAATKLVTRSAFAAEATTIVRDVCVIGGGSAGTYTAVRLGDFGKSVVVLEKKDRLGGHAETVLDPVTGIPVDIGVVVFENNPLVTGYFGRLGAPLISLPAGGGGGTTSYVDFRTGKLVPSYTPPSDAAFGAALGEYLGLLQGSFPYLDSGFNLPDPVPQDLLAPFATFVQKYGLGALVDNAYLFTEGVGNLLEDPALYVLKNFSLGVAGAIATGGFLAVPGGTNQLYDKAATYLGSNVVFGAEVLRVRRSERSGIEVEVLTAEGLLRVQCQKLVVACPPTLHNLAPFDLDPFEADTLGRFRANYYGTALVRLSGLAPGQTVQNVSASTPYNLAPLPGIYSLAPTQAPGLWNVKYGNASWLPDDVVKGSIVADINRMGATGAVPVTFEEFVAFSSHAPFEMMVSSEEIAAGFYTSLNALQGRHDTFYSSAAFQTNDSSLIWQFTEGLLPKIVA